MPKNRVTEPYSQPVERPPWPRATLLVLDAPDLDSPAYYMVTDEKDTAVNLHTGVVIAMSGWAPAWKSALRATRSVLIERE